MLEEKFNIKWDRHLDHLKGLSYDIYNDSIFTDVTLVSDDMVAVKAHQIILSNASLIMKELLLMNNSPITVLFLKGINHQELEAILQFVYVGEARVSANRIEAFANAAFELKIKELDKTEENTTANKENIYKPKDLQAQTNDNNKYIAKENETLPASSHKLEEEEFPIHEFDNFDIEQNVCLECNYKAPGKSQLKTHIDSIHRGIRYRYDECEYKATQISSLNVHKKAYRSNTIQECTTCNKQFKFLGSLKSHIKIIHEGIRQH